MKFANVVPAISMDNQRMQTTRFHFHKMYYIVYLLNLAFIKPILYCTILKYYMIIVSLLSY